MGSTGDASALMEDFMVLSDGTLMAVDFEPYLGEADEMAENGFRGDAMEHCMSLDFGAYNGEAIEMAGNGLKGDSMESCIAVDLEPFKSEGYEMVGNGAKSDPTELSMALGSEPKVFEVGEILRNNLKDDSAECCMAMGVADVESRGSNSANETVQKSVCLELVVYKELFEPYVGMQFECKEAAKGWYNEYARRVGFRMRVGRNERRKRDRELISWQFVCSKEGFRHKKYIERTDRVLPIPAHTREGCKAMLMVKKRADKWVVTRFEKEHNHELVDPAKAALLRAQRRAAHAREYYSAKKKIKAITLDSMVSEQQVVRAEEAGKVEPCMGMVFESKDAAKACYKEYASRSGFTIRVGRNERSKHDKECISWQFVCSKEGFHRKRNAHGKDGTSVVGRGRPTTREGCKAMLMVKKRGPDRWVVTRFETTHSHELTIADKAPLIS